MRFVQKQLVVAEVHPVVLRSTDCPLYDGVAFLQDEVEGVLAELH
jgi:hypothetical protein